MNSPAPPSRRGRTWFDALAADAPRVETGLGSVLVADASWPGECVRLIAVVPDPSNRFPRARQGELGLDEGWALARQIRKAIAADDRGAKRALVAIVDVKSQAYGRLEALLGLSFSLAAAVDAYASARMAGHPVVALIVGAAVSGGFLAHGAQAHRVLALDAPGVVVHAMGKESAARVTLRTVAALEALAEKVMPMSYDIRHYAQLGLLHELIAGLNADAPTPAHVARVQGRLLAAIAEIREHPGDLTTRLENAEARTHRAASIEVRRRMAEQWNAPNV